MSPLWAKMKDWEEQRAPDEDIHQETRMASHRGPSVHAKIKGSLLFSLSGSASIFLGTSCLSNQEVLEMVR